MGILTRESLGTAVEGSAIIRQSEIEMMHHWTWIPLPPPSLCFCLSLPCSLRGGQRWRCISTLSAAATFTLHEDESLERFTAARTSCRSQGRSRRTSNPQPVVSQDSKNTHTHKTNKQTKKKKDKEKNKQSSWIGINVGATRPSLQLHS